MAFVILVYEATISIGRGQRKKSPWGQLQPWRKFTRPDNSTAKAHRSGSEFDLVQHRLVVRFDLKKGAVGGLAVTPFRTAGDNRLPSDSRQRLRCAESCDDGREFRYPSGEKVQSLRRTCY